MDKKKEMWEYAEKLYNACSKETCYPASTNDWSEDNKFYGHCAVVTYLMYNKFGGDIKRAIIKEQGISHYWNYINHEDYDFTCSQFKGQPVMITDEAVVSPDRIISNPDTRYRCNILLEKANEPHYDFNDVAVKE